MSVKNKKDSAGKALYVEFRKAGYTYQFILTPEANFNGQFYPVHFIRRNMNVFQSRKNWAIDATRHIPSPPMDDVAGTFAQASEAEAKSTSELKLTFIKSTLSDLFYKEWKVFKNPIAVEVTYEDLDLIAQKKTPQALIRRIQRSRVEFGFGEELVSSEEPAVPVA
jgi:hypothetical protein